MASRARLAGLLCNTFSRLTLPSRQFVPATSPAVYVVVRGMASSKLFVGGLSFSTDERSLRDAFSVHGQVTEVKVIVDHETGRSRGFGFVSFLSEGEAEAALQKMDGQPLNGRIVRVNYATTKPREPRAFGPGDDGSSRGGADADGDSDLSFTLESLTGGGSWDDVLNDPVTRATLAQKNPYEDDQPSTLNDNYSSKGAV